LSLVKADLLAQTYKQIMTEAEQLTVSVLIFLMHGNGAEKSKWKVNVP